MIIRVIRDPVSIQREWIADFHDGADRTDITFKS
jgi:hypothetical protein